LLKSYFSYTAKSLFIIDIIIHKRGIPEAVYFRIFLRAYFSQSIRADYLPLLTDPIRWEEYARINIRKYTAVRCTPSKFDKKYQKSIPFFYYLSFVFTTTALESFITEVSNSNESAKVTNVNSVGI